jgi:hypothetical protein
MLVCQKLLSPHLLPRQRTYQSAQESATRNSNLGSYKYVEHNSFNNVPPKRCNFLPFCVTVSFQVQCSPDRKLLRSVNSPFKLFEHLTPYSDQTDKEMWYILRDRLCCPVVILPGCRPRGPGFDSPFFLFASIPPSDYQKLKSVTAYFLTTFFSYFAFAPAGMRIMKQVTPHPCGNFSG